MQCTHGVRMGSCMGVCMDVLMGTHGVSMGVRMGTCRGYARHRQCLGPLLNEQQADGLQA